MHDPRHDAAEGPSAQSAQQPPPNTSPPPPADASASGPNIEPPAADVRRHLLYALSLPERALRSTVGLAGGVIRESTSLLVPHAIRDCRTYHAFVQQTLDFLVQDVGGVAAAAAPDAEPRVEHFVARKTVGNFVEMAGLATLHLSPLLVLAVLSDVAYGSKTYLRELADELRRAGVIDERSTINSTEELLDAIGATALAASKTFDTPPLSLDGLRETVQQTVDVARRIDLTDALPQGEISRLWEDMRQAAASQRVSLLESSTAMTLYALQRAACLGQGALTTLRVAGSLFDRHLIDYYREALAELRARGYYATLAAVSGPYIEGVWKNFSTDNPSITEGLLSGKILGPGAAALSRWLGFSGKPQCDAPDGPPSTSQAPS
ncbi:MAG: hypothetical protein DCC67_17685 [Planctomycetota bacterium]|nr:MAG: hypothetical protein DCC67_17685 [Planctomycetota bacterium]